MKPDAKALQQWADQVTRHDFFSYAIGQLRLQALEAMTDAVREGDTKKMELHATKLLVLDDIMGMFSSLSIDVEYKRNFYEVLDDAE